MKRKKLLAILLAAAMLCQSTVVSLAGAPKAVETTDIAAQAEEILSKTYLEEERTYDGTAESRYAIPDEDLEGLCHLRQLIQRPVQIIISPYISAAAIASDLS